MAATLQRICIVRVELEMTPDEYSSLLGFVGVYRPPSAGGRGDSVKEMTAIIPSITQSFPCILRFFCLQLANISLKSETNQWVVILLKTGVEMAWWPRKQLPAAPFC